MYLIQTGKGACAEPRAISKACLARLVAPPARICFFFLGGYLPVLSCSALERGLTHFLLQSRATHSLPSPRSSPTELLGARSDRFTSLSSCVSGASQACSAAVRANPWVQWVLAAPAAARLAHRREPPRLAGTPDTRCSFLRGAGWRRDHGGPQCRATLEFRAQPDVQARPKLQRGEHTPSRRVQEWAREKSDLGERRHDSPQWLVTPGQRCFVVVRYNRRTWFWSPQDALRGLLAQILRTESRS